MACDGEFSGGDYCDNSGIGREPSRARSKPATMIQSSPTNSQSPNVTNEIFRASGSQEKYTAGGFYGEESMIGLTNYNIEYTAEVILVDQGSTWILSVNEQFEIGSTMPAKQSKTLTSITFYYSDGTNEQVNLTSIEGGPFQIETAISTTKIMQDKGQYPTHVIINITPSIEETFMILPPNGFNFHYKFAKENWQ